MAQDSREAVGRFVARARELAGSGEALAQRLGGDVAASTVNAWAQGRNPAPGPVLFDMAVIYDLSLDEYARTRPTTIEREVHFLRVMVDVLRVRLEEVLSDAGKEPLEFPEQALP